MPNYRKHLGELHSLKASGRRVAFFDLDRTLISVYSAIPLLREQVKAKQVSVVGALQQVFMALGHSREIYDFEEILAAATRMLEGIKEQEFSRLGDRLFHKHLQKKLYVEAQELVDTHRQLGHHLVIVSSATRYQIEPVAGCEFMGTRRRRLCASVRRSRCRYRRSAEGDPRRSARVPIPAPRSCEFPGGEQARGEDRIALVDRDGPIP